MKADRVVPSDTGGHVRACPLRPVARLIGLIPGDWIRQLEENQRIASCCRHPEHHTLEAFYSSRNWRNKLDPFGNPDSHGGVPDIYIFHCRCGRRHRRFMLGKGDARPVWGWHQRARESWERFKRHLQSACLGVVKSFF